MSDQVAQNQANIARNARLIFEVEASVAYNRAQAYVTRAAVLENAELIKKKCVVAAALRGLARGEDDD